MVKLTWHFYFVLTSILLFSLTFIYATSMNANSSKLFSETYEPLTIIAHRGASAYAPENTMFASQKAIELGADFLELDIQLSKDGEIVVVHDDSLSRVSGIDGFIRDFTLEELKNFDVGTFFHQDFSDQQIPTLEEVLMHFYEDSYFMIEIKKPHLYPGIEEKLALTVEKFEAVPTESSKFMIQSFDIESLQKIHALLPHIPKGLIISKKSIFLEKKMFAEISSFVSFINYKAKNINEKLVKIIHENNMAAFAWTINSYEEALRLQKIGIDGIVTDIPDLLIDVAQPIIAVNENDQLVR